MDPTPLRLYVNVDHVATLRQARRAEVPDPVAAAAECEAAGAQGITVHLREDRRHIQDRDVERLAGSVRTVLNLELAASPEIVAFACRLRPYQATLVPERREEVTTEGGLDVAAGGARLADAVARLRDAGIHVSLFIDPDRSSIEAAHGLGVPAVELHTGRYAHTWRDPGGHALRELHEGARLGAELGLRVHAGHGLDYDNVVPVARIAAIEELNIGHSIVSRAVFTGIRAATAEMARLVHSVSR